MQFVAMRHRHGLFARHRNQHLRTLLGLPEVLDRAIGLKKPAPALMNAAKKFPPQETSNSDEKSAEVGEQDLKQRTAPRKVVHHETLVKLQLRGAAPPIKVSTQRAHGSRLGLLRPAPNGSV